MTKKSRQILRCLLSVDDNNINKIIIKKVQTDITVNIEEAINQLE